MKSRNRLFHPHFPRGPSHSEEDNVLGKGKFGKIIRLKTGEGIPGGEIVIKIMHKRKVIENKMVNQVLEEQVCQSICSHLENVLPLLRSYQDSYHLYMAFPRCPTSLARVLAGQLQFPTSLLRAALAQLSSALRHIHDLGVVHRDVKPENVLVSECGRRLLLADFGLAKRLAKRKRTKTVCGTLQYLAPEVLEERPYTHSVDWWSLGVLGHRLAAGKVPWAKAQDHKGQLPLLDLRGVDLTGSAADGDVRALVVACFDPDGDARHKAALDAAKAVQKPDGGGGGGDHTFLIEAKDEATQQLKSLENTSNQTLDASLAHKVPV